MSQQIHSHEFDNGLILVAQSMDWLESSAFTLALPAGCAKDPSDRRGLGNFTCEMVQRGSGSLDSREFSEALDRLGTDRSASVSAEHTSYGAATLADKLDETLALYADLVRRPRLPASQMEEARQVCLHEVQAVEDDLAQMAMQHVRLQTFGEPCGRSNPGDREGVSAVTSEDVAEFIDQHYVPNGAILSVAGKIDWPRLRDQVEQQFGSWQGASDSHSQSQVVHRAEYSHVEHDSAQVHIAVSYPSIPYDHADFFVARGALGVLSDGMSSRLFTHVREEKGLCYTIYATYSAVLHHGRVLSYAATSTERAQETLDVMLSELVRLSDGIDDGELNRLKARVKSALIMQQESSTARSGAMAGDWYHLGRVRTKDEITKAIDGLTVDTVNAYLAENRASDFSIVTVGAEPLRVAEPLAKK